MRGLPGFGAKSERTLMERLSADLQRQTRYKLASVEAYAAAVLANLRDLEGVEKIEAAGSYRRRKETVGDLDFVAASRSPAKVIERFTSMPEAATTLAAGPTKASLVLKSGIQVDLRVVAPASYGAALLYFTGSKAHNIALRRMAQERGLKINEYGVYQGRGIDRGRDRGLGLSGARPILYRAGTARGRPARSKPRRVTICPSSCASPTSRATSTPTPAPPTA